MDKKIKAIEKDLELKPPKYETMNIYKINGKQYIADPRIIKLILIWNK